VGVKGGGGLHQIPSENFANKKEGKQGYGFEEKNELPELVGQGNLGTQNNSGKIKRVRGGRTKWGERTPRVTARARGEDGTASHR